MRRPTVAMVCAMLCLPIMCVHGRDESVSEIEPGVVHAALLTLPLSDEVAKCIGTKFLGLIELETTVRTSGEFVRIDLDSDEIFENPFTIVTGDAAFELTDEQVARDRKSVV